MYSLYRAWLMRDAVSATLASAPDVLINVGGHHLSPADLPSAAAAAPKFHQFAAHRHVVTVHSGYLKALLAATPAAAVSVPNIGPDAFGPLLTYMYTGYLDVNLDNIYAVLLATHLLHMPRALDLCRTFLLQNQPQTALRLASRMDELAPGAVLTHYVGDEAGKRDRLPPLVKPIASRNAPPGFWPHPAYPPLPPPPPLLPNDNSSFESVPASAPARPPTPRKRPRSPPAVASTSRRTVLMRARSPVRPASVSPCPSRSSCGSDEVDVNVSADEAPARRPGKKEACGGGGGGGGGHRGKVILDVACCDGPVRFHRVLNDNYGAAADASAPSTASSGGEENVGVASMRKELASRRAAEAGSYAARRKAARRVASDGPTADPVIRGVDSAEAVQPSIGDLLPAAAPLESIDDAAGEIRIEHAENLIDLDCQPSHDTVIVRQDSRSTSVRPASNPAYEPGGGGERPGPEPGQSDAGAAPSAAKSGAESVYTCVYCNHTFKSHYCYQKHARRHINPVALDVGGGSSGGKVETVCAKPPEKAARREVRLLDMNVQYYPCKTCGSKFPSYYFVHKHRKMCHADEADEGTASEESQTLSQSATIGSV